RRAEPKTEVDCAISRIKADQPLTHETKDLSLAMDCAGNRCRITGLLFPGLPLHLAFTGPANHRLAFPVSFTHTFLERFAGPGIKRDHARVWLATHHHEQAVAFQNRRAAHAEKGGWHSPIGARVALPD